MSFAPTSKEAPLEFKVPHQWVFSVLFFLLLTTLICFLKGNIPESQLVVPEEKKASLRRSVHPKIRILESPESYLVVGPELDLFQRKQFLEETADWDKEAKYVAVQQTWPEYFGFALIGFLCFSIILYLVHWRGQMSQNRFGEFCKSKAVLGFTALNISYALFAFLGWIWVSPLPFALAAFGLILLIRNVDKIFERLWLRKIEKMKSKAANVSYLEVKVSPPRRKQPPKVLPLSSFDHFFLNWLKEQTRLEPWYLDVVLQNHGMSNLKLIVEHFYCQDQAAVPSFLILQVLSTHKGSGAYLTSKIDQEVERLSF